MTAAEPAIVAAPARAEPQAIAFYDGTCGLCHSSVQFILRHETLASARPFFAPLFGETFEKRARHLTGGQVPDSLHVLTTDGRLLIRSRAVIHLCRGLGGGWARVATVASWCPTVLLNVVYRIVAATRKRLFKPTQTLCPIVPQELRVRFLP